MFVDASAIAAVLLREPGFEALLDALEGAEAPLTSPLAVFEAVCAILRVHRRGVGARGRSSRDSSLAPAS